MHSHRESNVFPGPPYPSVAPPRACGAAESGGWGFPRSGRAISRRVISTDARFRISTRVGSWENMYVIFATSPGKPMVAARIEAKLSWGVPFFIARAASQRLVSDSTQRAVDVPPSECVDRSSTELCHSLDRSLGDATGISCSRRRRISCLRSAFSFARSARSFFESSLLSETLDCICGGLSLRCGRWHLNTSRIPTQQPPAPAPCRPWRRSPCSRSMRGPTPAA